MAQRVRSAHQENGKPRAMVQRFARSAVSCAITPVFAVVGVTAAALAAPDITQAEDASTQATSASSLRRTYDIPAGSLQSALNQFGREAGIRLAFPAEITAGLQCSGLRGSYSVQEALSLLLHGSGLAAVRQANGSYALVEGAAPAPATSTGSKQYTALPAIKVTASPDQPGDLPRPYAGGQVARGGRLGMLGNTDFMDAPFNISSYTAQTIEDQQARTGAEVMANDPSVRVTASPGGALDSYSIRGFPINEGNLGEIAFDGIYGVAPTFRQFPAYIERMEVLKGPTALLYGIAPNGSVGGSINIVPKRAPAQDLTRFTADYASEAQFGGHLDLGRRFGDGGEFGARFNASYHNGDTPIDNQSREALVGSLALDYEGERLKATVDVIAQREDFNAPQRPLFPVAGIAIPKAPNGRRNIQQSWETSRIDDVSGLARVEYDLSRKLTLFAAAGKGSTVVERLFGTPILLSSAGDASVTPQNFIFDIDRTTAETGLRAQFDTAAIDHAVTLQADYFHARLGRGFNSGPAQSTNIFNPVARPRQDVQKPAHVPKVSENEYIGLALADTLSILDERVQLTLGVRRQHVKSENFSPTTGATTSSSDEGVFTPLFGLIVKPWENISLYANYTEGLSIGDTAPAIAVNAGETLAPFRSKQIEVGTKVDFGRLAVTLSAFQIDKPFGQLENRAGALFFTEAGEQRNQGVELNVFGEAVPGVRLLGGLTFLEGELTKSTSAETRGNTPIGVPSMQLNLGGEWDTPFLPRLTLVGNVIHTSDQFVDTANMQKIPSWTRLDLGARYRTAIMDAPVTFRATVQNVFDDDYWAGVASFGTLAQGAPRTVLLSVTTDF